jgi:hypothetical protein
MTVIPQLERQLAQAARRRRRRNVRAATVTAAVTVAAVAAVPVPVLLDSGTERQGVPAAPQPRPEQVNPPLEDLLGVFRRERTPRDEANSSDRDLEASGDRQPGESMSDSRRIDLPTGPVYLWRMKDGVCASWGNCLHTGVLAQLGVAVGYGGRSGADGRSRVTEVSGVVVDGIDRVELVPEHGDPQVVSVKDNVFRLESGDLTVQPTRVRWHQGGRWHHQDISLP